MGKLTIPIIREARGRSRATIHGRVEHFETEAEVEAAREKIGFLGFYHAVMDEDEYRATQADPAAVDRLFVDLATERLVRWMDLAESKLAGTGIRCYATGGNDDVPEVMAAMDRPDARAFVACEDRVVPLDDEHVMVSMPYVNPTPWHTPREAPEPELAARDRGGRRRVARLPEGHLQLSCPADQFDAGHVPTTRLDDRSAIPDRVGRSARPVRRRQRLGPFGRRTLPADARPPRPIMNRRPPRGSGTPFASIRAASTARGSCAVACSRSPMERSRATR